MGIHDHYHKHYPFFGHNHKHGHRKMYGVHSHYHFHKLSDGNKKWIIVVTISIIGLLIQYYK